MKALIFIGLLAASLTWDDPNSNPSSFKVYWGPTSASYTNAVETAATSVSLGIFNRSNVNYVAVTAVDIDGTESDFSIERLLPSTNNIPATNVITIGVDVLNSINVTGPFSNVLKHLDFGVYTNPPGGQVFAARMTISSTNISK